MDRTPGAPARRPRLVCFGAAHWDVIGRRAPGARGDDAPGTVERRPGGVALNLAIALVALGCAVTLVSAVGDDAEGRLLLEAAAAAGVATAGVVVHPGLATGRYVAIERADGELIAAVADAAALEATTPAHLALEIHRDADAWVLDANLPGSVIRALTTAPERPRLAANAVSEPKSVRLRAALPALDPLYCNRVEAEAICATGLGAARPAAEALLARGARRAVVTNGALAAADAGPHGVVALKPEPGAIRSATGLGDALMAAHLATTLGGAPAEAALAAGLAAARRRAA